MLDCLKKMTPDGYKFSSRTLEATQAGVKMQFLIEGEENTFKMM